MRGRETKSLNTGAVFGWAGLQLLSPRTWTRLNWAKFDRQSGEFGDMNEFGFGEFSMWLNHRSSSGCVAEKCPRGSKLQTLVRWVSECSVKSCWSLTRIHRTQNLVITTTVYPQSMVGDKWNNGSVENSGVIELKVGQDVILSLLCELLRTESCDRFLLLMLPS